MKKKFVKEEKLGDIFVKRLMESLLNFGYNITYFFFFTSFNLAKFLLEKNTIIVGTC